MSFNKLLNPRNLFIGVVLVFVGYCFSDLGFCSLEERGQFGDKFGALTSLFTGLAFVGVVWALRHEQEDSQARALEHRKLVETMTSQAEAAKRLADVSAINARLLGFNQQIEALECSTNRDDAIALARMRKQRFSLYQRLDCLLPVEESEAPE